MAAPLRPAPPPPDAAPSRPAAPVNRKPPGPGGGLDDLFGMGAGDNTRIKLPKPTEGDAPRPRRPVVSSPEELAKLGLDRRPPAAKPPPSTPAPSSTPPAPAKDDLPDE
ncbi:MAG: hypothetical protein FJ090_17310 [Deltaproteobacteria bacterium]|nr:hypothetical protein [Deltaproteobacteria bacterium]